MHQALPLPLGLASGHHPAAKIPSLAPATFSLGDLNGHFNVEAHLAQHRGRFLSTSGCLSLLLLLLLLLLNLAAGAPRDQLAGAGLEAGWRRAAAPEDGCPAGGTVQVPGHAAAPG